MSDKIDGYLYCYMAWPFRFDENGQRVLFDGNDIIKLASTFDKETAQKVLASFMGPGSAIHNKLPETEDQSKIDSILGMVEVKG